jgi:uncharacterized membrane protein
MHRERVGALIDAVYAIAMTILVLELPIPHSGEELSKSIGTLLFTLKDYVLTFILLFAFWYNQRRINELVEMHSRLTLWLNGMSLMLACLVPFSASLLFSLGKEPSSLLNFNYITFIDLLCVGICLSLDFFIHLSLWAIQRTQCHAPQNYSHVVHLLRSRRIVTAVVIFFLFWAFVLPGPNRTALIILPLLLMFEEEVVRVWDWGQSRLLKQIE